MIKIQSGFFTVYLQPAYNIIHYISSTHAEDELLTKNYNFMIKWKIFLFMYRKKFCDLHLFFTEGELITYFQECFKIQTLEECVWIPYPLNTKYHIPYNRKAWTVYLTAHHRNSIICDVILYSQLKECLLFIDLWSGCNVCQSDKLSVISVTSYVIKLKVW